MAQEPRTGTFEQVQRCLKLLAEAPAFQLEMAQIVSQMGAGAFTPGVFLDANGNTFSLSMNDLEFGDPATWVPSTWAQVLTTDAIPPAPPYPSLYILGQPGRVQTATGGEFVTDQRGLIVGWTYLVDFIAVAADDRAETAERAAYALMFGWQRLVRRNEALGGLVEMLSPEGPPVTGGPVSAAKSGNLAGVMQRFRVYVEDSLA